MLQHRSTIWRNCSILVLVVASMCLPALALAQTDEPAGTEAHAQYRKAIDAFNQKDWPEAQRLLLELWNRSQTYDVALTLGQVEYQLKHYAVAAQYLAFAIAHVPPFETAEKVARYRALLDEAKAVVASASIAVNQPNAEVLVDGEVIGTSPLSSPVFLDVGPHRIEARLGESKSPTQTIDVLAGEEHTVELQLEPSASPSAATNGQPAAATTNLPPNASDPGSDKNYTPAIISASVAGAALIGGVVLFVVASSKDSEREDLLGELAGTNPCGSRPDIPDECARIADLANGAATLRTVSFVSLGVAVAGGIATVLLWPKDQEGPTTGRGVVPRFSAAPGGWQVGASGRF